MKALFIGGTGTISMGIVRKLATDPLWEVYLLNRGNRKDEVPTGVKQIVADIQNEDDVAKKLGSMEFDTVSDFIAFDVEAVERDYRLFGGKTKQYIFISSASAYNKPSANYVIKEGTTLANPYWEYSRKKIACEEFLLDKYRNEGFPEGYKRLFINLGRRDGFYPGERMQTLNRFVGGRQEVGHIDLLDTISYFEVPEKDAKKVMIQLSGIRYKGRTVRCNDADDTDKAPGKSPSKPKHAQKKDNWRELMRSAEGRSQGKNKSQHGFKGEEPDFSEEGWAMRKPRKKKK